MDDLHIFVSIGTAIVLEAMPFLALGSVVSALVEVFVAPARLARLVPAGFPARVGVGLAAGLLLPTCECGVVPVARRLLAKGAPLPTVLAYLLTAPILNPVVLVSTYVAFGGSARMMLARAGVAVVVAAAVAFVLRRRTAADALRTRSSATDPSHDHDHHDRGPAAARVFAHAAGDFLEMGTYLVLGAFAAAAVKTFVPTAFLHAFEGSEPISIAGMMLFAIVLSVCSEADAFVAASFVTLPAAARLAFVAIGPMVDLKLIVLYLATFRRRVVGTLVVVPIVLVFLLCWLLVGVL